MKQRLTQLKARWQGYNPRERALFSLCAAVMGCAVLWYGVWQPLNAMNASSIQTLKRQSDTLRWMRGEIDSKHIPVRRILTENVRQLVEKGAGELKITLSNVQQKDKTLTFSVDRISFDDLENWMRELNAASGAHIEKLTLTPVDRLNVIKADVVLSWATA